MNEPPVGLLQPGNIVGDSYRVESLIGKGGMGEVWAARHLRLAEKRVAIKVLRTHGEALSEETLKRFRREAEIASRLEHPHIVSIYDYNLTPAGHPFMVMEFLEGESLGTRLRRGPLSLAETRVVLRQICSALETTHNQSILHRDLKPDNIFLTNKGAELWVKVLDFGISKILDAEVSLTKDWIVVGSPRYMSPEQARGQNSQLTPQADIFSLGAMAYEMLTGKPAFEGDGVSQVLYRVVYETPRPLEQLVPDLPLGVRRAIDKALKKEPADRYSSAMAFSSALGQDEPPPTAAMRDADLASLQTFSDKNGLEPINDTLSPRKQKHRSWWLLFLALFLAVDAVVLSIVVYQKYLQTGSLSAAFEDLLSSTADAPPKTPSSGTEENTLTRMATEKTLIPGTETPGTGTPGTGTPGTGTPGTGTPGTETPGTGTPGAGTQETGTPGAGTPGDTEKPVVEDPKKVPSEPGPGGGAKKPGGSKTPVRTPVGEPPNAEERSILLGAEKALQAKRYHEAERLARRALTSLEEDGAGAARAFIIIVEIACAQKDLGKYNAAYASVPGPWKASARTSCKRQGFDP
ncbi:MAG: serine/threonine protein kinase [Cystobacterineae bacterium]|nr:serine/threonine protein kinase [Cystobacterineae bacterium]